jgi:anoctamin-10
MRPPRGSYAQEELLKDDRHYIFYPSLPTTIHMPPIIDLVVVFRTNTISLSKQQTRDDALKTEQQYTKLLETLTKAGLRAIGRRGETQGHILVLISCPQTLLGTLVHRER